jgi:hypothetical protein
MIVPKGAPTFAKPSATARKSSTPSRKSSTTRSSAPAAATKAASPRPQVERARARSHRRSRSSRPATSFRQGHLHRPRSRQQRVLRQGNEKVRLQEIGRQQQDRRGNDRLLPGPGQALPHHLHRGRLAENDWDGWKKLTDAMGKTPSSSATISSSPTSSSSKGHRRRRRQLDSRQGQPDRLAHRNLRRRRAGQAHGYTSVLSHRSGESEDTTIADIAVATQRRPDQDRLLLPHRPPRQVQPAAPHRGGKHTPDVRVLHVVRAGIGRQDASRARVAAWLAG